MTGHLAIGAELQEAGSVDQNRNPRLAVAVTPSKLGVQNPKDGFTQWFDDPAQEHSAEEIGEEVVLIKNREGRIIGFERLNYTVPADEFLSVDAIAV